MYFFEKYTHYPKIYFLSEAKDLGKHWYKKVLLFKIAFKILWMVLDYLPDHLKARGEASSPLI